MLLLIIFGILLIGGIALGVISAIRWDSDCVTVIGVVTAGCGGLALLACSIVAIVIQANKDNSYHQMLYKAEVIEYRLEHREENLVGSELLYSDIVKFNNELRTHKVYSTSPWIGLFYNDKIATIDYIKIK